MIDRGFGDSPVHVWFNLSYCSYLVLPRSALQTMPDEWQARFIAMVDEIRETIDLEAAGNKDNWPVQYDVRLRGPDGRYVDDPLREYGRGARMLPLRHGQQ